MNFEGIRNFYEGKRILVTGHTGFKGSWLCKILAMAGAHVYGYSLDVTNKPNLFELLNIQNMVHSEFGDVRDYEHLHSYVSKVNPEFVFHLAAQPIVRESYKIPRQTFETNIMGTVNMLECIRLIPSIRSFLNVTTDKVYENNGLINHAFVEDEKLDGYDPYSNSKSCSELVTHSYINSFFSKDNSVAVSTARAGNVIGGGDFAADRIIPDCVRATIDNKTIEVRNPHSIRPYQHVLEPLSIYLTIVMMQSNNPKLAGYYNVGPEDSDCITTGQLADLFVKYWGKPACWKTFADLNAPHEADYLRLDCNKLKNAFGWTPVWHIDKTIKSTVEWYKAWKNNKDLNEISEMQILDFFK